MATLMENIMMMNQWTILGKTIFTQIQTGENSRLEQLVHFSHHTWIKQGSHTQCRKMIPQHRFCCFQMFPELNHQFV
jgi:hypothetical protein